jgi:hypothetical protein
MFSPYNSIDESTSKEPEHPVVAENASVDDESDSSNSFSFFGSPDSVSDAASSSGGGFHVMERNRIKIQLSRRPARASSVSNGLDPFVNAAASIANIQSEDSTLPLNRGVAQMRPSEAPGSSEEPPLGVEQALWEEFERQPSIQLLRSIRRDLQTQLASIISDLEQSLSDTCEEAKSGRDHHENVEACRQERRPSAQTGAEAGAAARSKPPNPTARDAIGAGLASWKVRTLDLDGDKENAVNGVVAAAPCSRPKARAGAGPMRLTVRDDDLWC